MVSPGFIRARPRKQSRQIGAHGVTGINDDGALQGRCWIPQSVHQRKQMLVCPVAVAQVVVTAERPDTTPVCKLVLADTEPFSTTTAVQDFQRSDVLLG